MNVYKYAKRHAETQLDIELILDSDNGVLGKTCRRLLMVHRLAWYYYFSRLGNRDLAKQEMANFIYEVKQLPKSR